MVVRGTTPKLEFGIPFDASAVQVIFVTFTQSSETVFEKSISDVTISDKKVVVCLSQKDTLLLDEKKVVQIQLRIKTTDGSAYASKKIFTNVEGILKDGLI